MTIAGTWTSVRSAHGFYRSFVRLFVSIPPSFELRVALDSWIPRSTYLERDRATQGKCSRGRESLIYESNGTYLSAKPFREAHNRLNAPGVPVSCAKIRAAITNAPRLDSPDRS